MRIATALVTVLFSVQTIASQNSYKEERLFLKNGKNRIEVISKDTLADPTMPNRYSIRNLFDNNSATAWVTRYTEEMSYKDEGAFRIIFDRPVYVKSMSIRNGYQKTDKLYFANQRARTLNIEKIVIGNKRLPYEYTVGIKDKLGDQEISLQDGWAQSLNMLKTKELIFNILGIYDGAAYKDLCISDVTLRYSDKIDYLPSTTWEDLRKSIDAHSKRDGRRWVWDGLTKNDYKLFNDLLYYALTGNKEAYLLFDTYAPRESMISSELLGILKTGLKESVQFVKE